MFNLNKDIDYSLVFLSYLLRQKKLLSLAEISNKTNLPRRFLAKISAILSKNHIVKSKEGKNGGYALNKKSLEISFYDYLRIFNSDLSLLSCNKKDCCCKKKCYHKKMFQEKIENIFFSYLKKIKIKDLL